MNKKPKKKQQPYELRSEYGASLLRSGVRGKYTARYRAGTNLVLLSPDVARYFPIEASVDAALRTFMRMAKPRRGSSNR